MTPCLAYTNSLLILQSGETKPCCYFAKNLQSNLDIEMHNKLLYEYDVAVGCKHCIDIEKHGGPWSHRNIFKKDDPFVFSIFFDTVCNQSCVTCNPTSSNSVNSEWYNAGLSTGEYYDTIKHSKSITIEQFEKIKQLIKLKVVDPLKIEIFGGEPTLSPYTSLLLKWLVDTGYSKNVTLAIVTNGANIQLITKYLTEFKQIIITISLDGINEQFEYLRYGTSFENMQLNLDTLYALQASYDSTDFLVGYNYTLSWMNSMHFVEFIKWMSDRYPNINSYMTNLCYPYNMSIDNLSLHTKQQLIKNINDISAVQSVGTSRYIIDLYIGYITTSMQFNGNIQNIQTAIEFMKKLDVVRGTSCELLFKNVIAEEYKHVI